MDTTDNKDQPAREGKFFYESVQDAKTLVEYLRALTDGFEKGEMRFSRKDLDMTLSPKGLIGFAVEAKAKEGRMKLALKFAWREAVADPERDTDNLVITSGGGE
ncbi:amphi-Trp domain-containing protein [Fundidesulfovibrio terrae]|uniref:amphi-Trp domain-containing protein n=1 Tax=Fundidesulfovibrio terrae TaxID=2922866 RepID=UPI001FB04295|nr:amphi-Trp domain-containing protein [Fundidesulfovibrio terrae]